MTYNWCGDKRKSTNYIVGGINDGETYKKWKEKCHDKIDSTSDGSFVDGIYFYAHNLYGETDGERCGGCYMHARPVNGTTIM